MTILLTSFSPFGGDELNASQEVMNALPDQIGDAVIEKLCLPVVFLRSAELTIKAAERLRPDAIVCLGQAGGRAFITPERVAVHLMDAAILDNDNYQPEDVPIIPNGPAAYFSTLPIKAIAAAMQETGVPAQISNSAGTYVCNSLMYSVLHYTAAHRPEVPCGFIHVPYLDIQTRDESVPALPKDYIVRAITAALRILTDKQNKRP